MKKFYTSEIYKIINNRRACNSLQLRTKRIKLKQRRKKHKIYVPPDFTYQEYRRYTLKQKYYDSHRPPDDFLLIENTEEAIKFINKIEKSYLNRSPIFVNIRHLTSIDYPAIAVLLSVMFTVKSKGINFDGNYPKNNKMNNQIQDSDFFKHLANRILDKDEYKIGKKSQIFTRSHRQVNAKLCKNIMEDVSTSIWGKKRMLKGLTRILIELMHNTNNHASVSEKGVEHWWLSVNYQKTTNSVKFVFVDYGVGIFESLRSKPINSIWDGVWEKFVEPILFRGKDHVFKAIMEGKMHESVTGLSYRGKGLPGIKEVMTRNQISNLIFITNNVYADVSKNSYKKMNHDFCGTLAYWEINENNENSEWTIES